MSYYEKNRDKILQRQKEYNALNKEKYQEYMKTYYKNNKDKFLDRYVVYRENNKQKVNAYMKEYMRRTKDTRKKIINYKQIHTIKFKRVLRELINQLYPKKTPSPEYIKYKEKRILIKEQYSLPQPEPFSQFKTTKQGTFYLEWN